MRRQTNYHIDLGLSKLSELVVVNVTTFLLNQNLFITINLEKLGI